MGHERRPRRRSIQAAAGRRASKSGRGNSPDSPAAARRDARAIGRRGPQPPVPGGTVRRCVERHAISRDEALAEIEAIMTADRLTPAQAADAATHEAASYLLKGADCWYHDEALALLVDAHADLDQARE